MRIGFIGLGTMGASMALNARTKGGYDLVVHDLRRDAAKPHLAAGCTWADSPAAVGKEADIVLTSLPGPRDVEAVAEGLIQTMRPGTPWFDLSTNSPTVMRRLHARFGAKGAARARRAGQRRAEGREERQAGDLGRRRQGRVR